tara:strand:- start:4099 stop:4686 length:588 start_codon:yes stop_codon:yes gene_type:complete
MAPSLRDAVMRILLGLFKFENPMTLREKKKYKMITRLCNPATYRNSVDKKPHENAGTQGSKRGGHFYWLIRQVRLLTDVDNCKDPVASDLIMNHASDILAAFPVFDPSLEQQSVEFQKFDCLVTEVRNSLSIERMDKIVKRRQPKISVLDRQILSGLKSLCKPMSFLPCATVVRPIPVSASELNDHTSIDTSTMF